MNVLLTTLLQFLASRWNYVGVATAAIGAIYAYVIGVIEKVEEMITQLDAISAPAFESVGLSLSPFGVMNYVLPLDLAVTLFGVWLVFWLACVGVRIVKAWIPTVS